MANEIRIKRSISTNSPVALAQGELAYSESASPNGLGQLFIGINGASLERIGGKDIVDIVDALDLNLQTLTVPASTTISTFGASLVDDADAPAARTTLGVDAAGTDNSTDVTLAAGLNYLTISGQIITLGSVDLATDITGNLPVTNLNSGTTASSATFWRGDGTWATPAGSGDVSFNAGVAPANNALVRFDGITGTIIQESGIIIDDTENVSGVGTLNTHTIQGGTGTLALLTDVSYSQLNTNGDVGTGAAQVAAGDHNHTGVYEPVDATIVRNTDSTVLGWSFIVDEDNMVSDSATLLPTQQSVKAYVDGAVTGGVTYKGAYDASTDTPALDGDGGGSPIVLEPIVIGDMYTITVAGTFFATVVEAGDVLIAEQSDATLETHWTIVNKNLGSVASSAITLTAGTGLTGGGDLTANRTFDFDFLGLTTEAAVDGAADYFAFYDAAVGHRKVLLNDMLDGGSF